MERKICLLLVSEEELVLDPQWIRGRLSLFDDKWIINFTSLGPFLRKNI